MVLGILVVVLLAGGVLFRDTFMPIPRGGCMVMGCSGEVFVRSGMNMVILS